MSAKTLIVTKSDNTTDITYTEVFTDKTSSQMVNLSSSSSEPEKIEHRFDIKSAGQKGNNKASATIVKTLLNSTTGIANTATLTLSLSVPNNEAAFTATVQKDILRQLVDMFGGAAGLTLFVNWARGVTPDGDQHVDGYTA